MFDVFKIFALLQEGRDGMDAFFARVGEYFSQLQLGGGELSIGGLVVALVLVWFFVRLVRTLVSVLIGVCVLLLVLHFAGVVDLSSLWEQLQVYLGSAPPAEEK